MTATASGAIVVGLDRTPASADALMWAVDQAVLERRPLAIVHAYGPRDAAAGWALVAQARRDALRVAPDLWVQAAAYDEPAGPLLRGLARAARMIVLGSAPRRGWRHRTPTGVAADLVRRGSAPVVVVRGWRSALVPGRVVVAADLSPESAAAMTFGFAQARRRGVPLSAVFCPGGAADARERAATSVEAAAAERMAVADRLAGFRARHVDVDVDLHIGEPPAVERLVEWSMTADLIVVGVPAPGTTGGRAIGDVARLLQDTRCTVAAVPATAPREDAGEPASERPRTTSSPQAVTTA